MSYDHVRFTASQLRALAALSGEWMFNPPRSISAAIQSLALYYPQLVQTEAGNLGPRGGWARRARLTLLGTEVKKARSL